MFKGIEFIITPAKNVNLMRIDIENIHTCLTNLVSNAIDACLASDKSGRKIHLEVIRDGKKLIYKVSDTGCGMDHEIKNKVFTTFFNNLKWYNRFFIQPGKVGRIFKTQDHFRNIF